LPTEPPIPGASTVWFEPGQRQRDLRRQIGHRKAGRDEIIDRVRHERQMFGSHQQPILPRAILTDAVGSGEHHAASDLEIGSAGILDDEHQRRLGPRVSARQNCMIERRHACGRNVDQRLVLSASRLGQFDLPQASMACEGLRLDRTHRRSHKVTDL
jgi:hypothetical protein